MFSINSIVLLHYCLYGRSPKEVTTNKLAISGEGSYVLTKTHCGGYCFGCNPKYYLQTQEEFQDDCLTSEYMAKNGTKQKALYDPSIISKAIHLIRDPFDNVVSRFHLKRNAMVHKDDKEWLESYPNSKKGFRAFCEYINTKNGKREKQHAVNGTDGSNVFLKVGTIFYLYVASISAAKISQLNLISSRYLIKCINKHSIKTFHVIQTSFDT